MGRLSIFVWGLPICSALIVAIALVVYWWHFGAYETSLNPESWGQFGDYMGGVLNPVLSLFALVAVLITLRVQMNELASAGKMATLNADTAVLSAKISQSTLVSSNRAHIVFIQERYISHPDQQTGNVFWQTYARWINRGNTPAMRCQIVVRSKLVDSPLSGPEDLDWTAPLKPQILSISPSAELSSGMGAFAGSDLQQVKAGTKFLYMWGWCMYRDIFDDTPIRRTQFALVSGSVTGDPEKVWDPNSPFNLHMRHFGSANLVDEDCNNFVFNAE